MSRQQNAGQNRKTKGAKRALEILEKLYFFGIDTKKLQFRARRIEGTFNSGTTYYTSVHNLYYYCCLPLKNAKIKV